MDGLDGRAGGRTDGRPAGDGKTCPDALAAVDQSPTVYPSDLGARARMSFYRRSLSAASSPPAVDADETVELRDLRAYRTSTPRNAKPSFCHFAHSGVLLRLRGFNNTSRDVPRYVHT